MKQKFTFLFILLPLFNIFSQVTNEGKPLSWDLQNVGKLSPIVLPKVDLKKLQEEDLINDKRKDIPWRFGQEIIVDYNLENSGVWTTLENGDRIWRIRFVSEGAKTMNFVFSDFYMPEKAKLYLYSNDKLDVLGAYDSKQNNDERVLGTWLVKGADVWLEYYEPKTQIGKGKLEVFKVIHGYRTAEDNLKAVDDDLNASGACNYDVDCNMGSIDTMKDINKKSIALMIVSNNSFCTGALINNTSNDGTPYFLTANHCYSNPSTWSFRFNWISPNPVCAQNQPSTNMTGHLTISGATLRARRTESDFCLVQINSQIPSNWDVRWAGWDRTDNVPTSTFGIHHPSGDIMKVCVDNNSPVALNNNGNYWRVLDWDLGVTEGGSSGSPFFNNQGRIIGQLWRGSAACSGTVDNGGTDDYGRFAISWNTGTSSSSRLRDWLDPTGTNALTTDVYPPTQVFAVNAKVAILSVNNIVCGNTITPIIKLTNNGSEILTSATIQCSINTDTPITINWTGNLEQGQYQEILVDDFDIANGENTFYVNVENPNGVADNFPNDNQVSYTFSKADSYETTSVQLTILTDNYGNETTWDIRDSNNTNIASGGPYNNRVTINQTINLPNNDCYTFTINDSEGDGICCSYGIGNYSLKTLGGTTIIQGGSFGSNQSKLFYAAETLSNNLNQNSNALITVYPNPSNEFFTITNNQGNDMSYQIFNLLGQKIQESSISNTSQIKIENQSTGIYILKIVDIVTKYTDIIKLIKK
jgi:hypothetical protein